MLMNIIWNFLENIRYREQLFIMINMFFFAVLGGVIGFIIRIIFPDLLNSFMIYFLSIGYSTMLLGLFGGLVFLYRKL